METQAQLSPARMTLCIYAAQFPKHPVQVMSLLTPPQSIDNSFQQQGVAKMNVCFDSL